VVVRHAEKSTDDPRDPNLSAAGYERARALIPVLSNAGVTDIYTTQFKRTRQTAEPFAQQMGITIAERPVNAASSAAYASDLAREILTRSAGKGVLVVGHSNTVPDIVRALSGSTVAPITDTEYEHVFTVVVPASGSPRLTQTRLSLPASPAMPADTRSVAERLGYPANAKLLILHADDLGAAHSINAASFDALDKGAISSASAMVPTPWITEVAAYARKNPNADIGLHLTLTSEWQTFRWGSVESPDKVATLLDSTGTFPNDEKFVAARARPLDAEREIRAQINRALAIGIRPTHLDSHMGALFTTPDLIATYVKVAHDYHLPFLALKGSPLASPQAGITPQDVLLDAVLIADGQVPRDQWKAFYLKSIADLKPGLTELIVHLGYDDSELQAVMVDHEPFGSAWRQKDYDVVNSAEFKKALKDNGVILVSWRDLQKLLPAK
jgi:predicted glycoside hydrolase/deacetylase ChbG (UPF0249 family)/phosphohistidine phosphatase SixA